MELIRNMDLLSRTHAAYRSGDESRGLKNTLYLLGNGFLKRDAQRMYQMFESAVIGGHGSDKLFGAMLDQGMVSIILKKAKAGEIQIVKEFLGAVGRLEEDIRYEVLNAV